MVYRRRRLRLRPPAKVVPDPASLKPLPLHPPDRFRPPPNCRLIAFITIGKVREFFNREIAHRVSLPRILPPFFLIFINISQQRKKK